MLFIETNSKNKHYTIQQCKNYITFVIHSPLMMAQSWAESTWEITNYGRFINQFPPNIIRSIRQFERINKKYVDKKCLLCSIKYVYVCVWGVLKGIGPQMVSNIVFKFLKNFIYTNPTRISDVLVRLVWFSVFVLWHINFRE